MSLVVWEQTGEFRQFEVVAMTGSSVRFQVRERCVSSDDPAVVGGLRWSDVPVVRDVSLLEDCPDPVACAGCRYVERFRTRKWRSGVTSHCHHPEARRADRWRAGTGETTVNGYQTAAEMRLPRGACGPFAALFEAGEAALGEVAKERAVRLPRVSRFGLEKLGVGEEVVARGWGDAVALRSAAALYRKRHPGWWCESGRFHEDGLVAHRVRRVACAPEPKRAAVRAEVAVNGHRSVGGDRFGLAAMAVRGAIDVKGVAPGEAVRRAVRKLMLVRPELDFSVLITPGVGPFGLLPVTRITRLA